MKIGVLSNPLSRRTLKQLPAIRDFFERHDTVLHHELTDFAALRSVLEQFAAAGIELLVVNAGDGTVSAVLTEIYEHGVFPVAPIVAILPGGTSNTIARDVGLRGGRVSSLQRLFDAVEHGEIERHVTTRRLIRVEYGPERRAVFGMFFGTAAICAGIELRLRMFPQTWIPDPLAGTLTLAYVLASVVLGLGNDGDILSGETMAIDLDRVTGPEKRYSLVIVTTLRRIFLGSSPFWGDGGRGLEFTSIGSPALGLVRHAWRLLYGRDKNALPRATYTSASVDRLALHTCSSFTLDGEFYDSPTDKAVVLTGTTAARFVQC